jgi:hypothetical protein
MGSLSEFIFLSRFRLFDLDEEPFITLPLWRQCQDAPPGLPSFALPLLGLALSDKLTTNIHAGGLLPFA